MRIGDWRCALTRIRPRLATSIPDPGAGLRYPPRGRRGGVESLPQPRNRVSQFLAAGAVAVLLVGPSPISAADESPAVDLDRLLQLPPPEPFIHGNPRPGGATRTQWKARFSEARGDLEKARMALAAAKQELEELAGDSAAWRMAVPGGQPDSNANSPVSFRLIQEIRRQREEVAHGQRRMKELEVEANLAGVPEDWSQPPDPNVP